MHHQLDDILLVKGNASGRKIELKFNKKNLQQSLMHFLQQNSIPIASSCRGEGVCKKCQVMENVLSCQISLENYLNTCGSTVEIDYL